MDGPRSSARAFADAAAALVGEHNIADVLVQLMTDCADLLGAKAAAILVLERTGELSLLSSSSHGAVELELLQIQRSEGPCVDAINYGKRIRAVTSAELAQRWGEVGQAMAEAGMCGVEAVPMRWRGRVLGGVNIFRDADAPETDESRMLSQAFADVATLVIVQSTEVPDDQISARVHEAVMARSQIEQAKGVLSYVSGVDMAEAYEQLKARARTSGASLSDTATSIVLEQWDGA